MQTFTESVVEEVALTWLDSLGWTGKCGLEIAHGELTTERAEYGQVIPERRRRDMLLKLISRNLQVKNAERFIKEVPI